MGLKEEIPLGSEIKFDYVLPVSAEVCQQNIADNLNRGLPEALRRKRLTIIANGPSALEVPLGAIGTQTMALNGSISLFVDQGVPPDYWACCDPQELVADLLPDDPPLNTIYFVASKCHPAVFAKLKNRDVRIWHLADHDIPGAVRISLACSITISAAWLMHRLGFTDFDFYGWDGCFMDGRHHASDTSDWGEVPLFVNYGGKIEGDDVIGGRNFPTTRTWAAEAEAAGQFFQLAKYFDMGVKVHGDGMIKATQDSLLP